MASTTPSVDQFPQYTRKERRRLFPPVDNLSPYLPALVRFEGEPINTDDYFPFKPLYSTRIPEAITLRAGRGVGKSVGLMARLLVRLAGTKNLQAMVVAPLQNQSDRLSAEYFQPMLRGSPLAVSLRRLGNTGSIRRQLFDQNQVVNFLYAFDSADRLRGFHLHDLTIDEMQDFAPEFLPVANECASKPNATKLFSGTSKTTTTALEEQYAVSTRSVWVVRCRGCGFSTWFCARADGGRLEDVIGEYDPGISEARPGTVCPGCLSPINPRFGYWGHRSATAPGEHLGLHIPQPIMPHHFASAKKWRALLRKRDGKEPGYTLGRYYNEVLGEPWDQSQRLLGRADLAAAAVLGPNTLEAAAAAASGRYSNVHLGVDWGGGGEDGVSCTAVAAAGRALDGRMEVFYGEKFVAGGDRIAEADRLVAIARAIRPDFIAHDYNGLGTAQEGILTLRGWPAERIIPIVYNQGPGQLVIDFVAPAGHRTRGFYHLDKARGLQLLAQAVRAKSVVFFQDDYKSPSDPGILNDFHNLVEEYFQGPVRGYYRVRQALSSTPDDFAHAVNMACWSIWHATESKPRLA